jgi:hypothetical protein
VAEGTGDPGARGWALYPGGRAGGGCTGVADISGNGELISYRLTHHVWYTEFGGRIEGEGGLVRLPFLARAVYLPLDPAVDVTADPPVHKRGALEYCVFH